MTQEEYIKGFEEITTEMVELTRRKNSDYAGGDDAFKNLAMVERFGVTSTEVGVFTRLTDKMSRLAGFLQKGTLQVADEKIEDTLKDQAVYSIMLILLLRDKKLKASEKALYTGPALRAAKPITPGSTISE